jgi:transposase
MSEATARQVKAIAFVVSSSTYSEAIEKAGVSRKTFYEWLKEPQFKAEIDRQRSEIIAEAFSKLSQSLTKAVETLVGLLNQTDDRVKRLVREDVTGHVPGYSRSGISMRCGGAGLCR